MNAPSSPDAFAWMALAARPRVGPTAVRRLVRKAGSAWMAWEAWARQDPLAASDVEATARDRLAQLEGLHAYAVTLDDPRYPALLRHIHDAPPVLYVRGALPEACAWRRALAVVGTRSCTPQGAAWAREVGRDWVAAGGRVVSGLARGVDAAAHRGGLGATVAVLPCGLDAIHPRMHADLAEAIVAGGGLLVTEQPPGAQVERWMFAARNRIVTGLCPATVVVQSPSRGGSLISAQCALDQDREVYTFSPVGVDASWSGNRSLATSGSAVCVHDPAHLWEVMAGLSPPAELEHSVELDVWNALDARTARTPHDLQERLAFSQRDLEGLLLTLERQGLARRTWGARWLRR